MRCLLPAPLLGSWLISLSLSSPLSAGNDGAYEPLLDWAMVGGNLSESLSDSSKSLGSPSSRAGAGILAPRRWARGSFLRDRD